jgi:hypothetical protein
MGREAADPESLNERPVAAFADLKPDWLVSTTGGRPSPLPCHVNGRLLCRDRHPKADMPLTTSFTVNADGPHAP